MQTDGRFLNISEYILQCTVYNLYYIYCDDNVMIIFVHFADDATLISQNEGTAPPNPHS